MDNKLWLTEEQIEVIVSILKKQCERIEERNQKLSDDFPDLFDELYYTGRGHGDTGAVYAGFTEATEIPDMKVYRVKYGRGYSQPELHSDTAVIQLYNSGAGKVLDSIEIKDKCRQYNYAGSQKKYGAIQFWTSKKGHLTRAELVEFDEKGSEVKRTIIYKYNAKLIPFVA